MLFLRKNTSFLKTENERLNKIIEDLYFQQGILLKDRDSIKNRIANLERENGELIDKVGHLRAIILTLEKEFKL
jgi:hypothetical protein